MRVYDEARLREISAAAKDWEEGDLKKTIERYSERKDDFRTPSGLSLERLYTPVDLRDSDYLDRLGFPGRYPFTRGVQPTMYRGRLWTMRQYAGFGTAEETNRRFRYLLDQGQTGLSVAFDLPTQLGYDSDHELAEGEVGRVGVAIDSVEDMARLFDGIPLDRVSTSMTINAPAAVLLAMYTVLAEERGLGAEGLKGTVQNDILKEYVARGTYIFPPRPSMRLITDLFRYCSEELPAWNTISISGYHIREAGATAVQELAFTLANAIAYVQAAVDAGLEVDRFAPRLSFFFAAGSDFLEEVAKFRAARRLWARIMKERFGARDARSMRLRFHTQTAGSSLTAQEPLNNVVRVAVQALAAVMGGTQSLHTNSYDEAHSLPTEESVRVALRTQQIIGYESGVVDTVDPLGGSYAVEALTDEIESAAVSYIERIDSIGGAVSAIEDGYVQSEIFESAYRHQKEVESRQRVVVGVNKFATGERSSIEILRVDPGVADAQKRRIDELRRKRDGARARRCLEALRRAAEGDDNLVPPIVEAVRARATLGEICGTLKEVFGQYVAPPAF